MENRERARKSIIQNINEMQDDNVLRSICFVIGDYAVCEDGKKRASVISNILLNCVNCSDIENLVDIFAVSRILSEKENQEKH